MNFPRPSTPIFWGSATAMVSSGIALVSDSLRELPVSVTVAAVMTGISGVIAAAGGIKVSLVKISADQKQFEMKMQADQLRLELEMKAEQQKLELTLKAEQQKLELQSKAEQEKATREIADKRHDLAGKLNTTNFELACAKDEIKRLSDLLMNLTGQKVEPPPPKES